MIHYFKNLEQIQLYHNTVKNKKSLLFMNVYDCLDKIDIA